MRGRAVAVLIIGSLAASVLAQQPSSGGGPRSQVDDRLRLLRQEAERLAGESKTLLGEVRKLEVQRDIRIVEARQADAALAAAREDLASITSRLDALEEQRRAGLPDLQAQLVEMYKRGRSGHLRLLLSAGDLSGFARASRAVTALAYRRERILSEYQQTLAALQGERTTLETHMRELRTRDAAARQARQRAEQAVAARAALIEQIDSRRDLTAQYVGELQAARERLDQQIALEGRADATVPIGPFQGALEWPAAGDVSGRFGQPAGRAGGPLVRNGIEIAAPDGAPVHAVHGGRVEYAEGYTGLGNLVILDHGGNNYSLYGYLSAIGVKRGDRVEAGDTVGRVGPSPAGPTALYFEMRIDGRFVDPVQWLKPR